MIKMKDLLDKSKQTGHISNHHPGRAFSPNVEESIADDDAKAAKRIRNNLTVILHDIDKHMGMIDKEMSSFNAPGLKHAFIDAIKIGSKRQGKWDVSSAQRRLNDYYKK